MFGRSPVAHDRRSRVVKHLTVVKEVFSSLRDALEVCKQDLDRQTVEHPFGTIKSWMGWTHFLTKTQAHVRTEMSLHALAYNLKRVMRIRGIAEMMAAMRA